MSYQGPPQWNPNQQPQGYPPQWQPAPPKSSTRVVVAAGIAAILGGCCVIGMLGRSGGAPETAPTSEAPIPQPVAQAQPVAPDDSRMMDFPDNERPGEAPTGLAANQVAIGNLEGPPPEAGEREPRVEAQLWAALRGHCVGVGRARRCPDRIVLLASESVEVTRGPAGVAVRLATMIPRPDPDGLRGALNLCNAARYELARAGSAPSAVRVYQWDGRTVIASSLEGGACR